MDENAYSELIKLKKSDKSGIIKDRFLKFSVYIYFTVYLDLWPKN